MSASGSCLAGPQRIVHDSALVANQCHFFRSGDKQMRTASGVVLRRIVTNFLSSDIVLATQEQAAFLSKFDPESKSESLAEIGQILHDILLAEEQLVVRWERRRQP